MNKIGFNTIGVPKITGSLMLNAPGPIDRRDTPRNCALFATINTTTKTLMLHQNHQDIRKYQRMVL